MPKSDYSTVKEDGNIGNMFCSNQNQESKKLSSIQDENEFLRMQAIQNRAEIESLQKSPSFSIDKKERLEMLVENLAKQLEGIRSAGMVGDGDQMEVKTMVQAIACASQIKLSKENDELCQKIKVLIEDNNKLIELYEQVAKENSSRALGNTETDLSSNYAEAQDSAEIALEVEKSAADELKKMIGNLENQLSEMHEENEKLMSLYENAMKEKDEFRRLLSAPGQDKLIEADGVDASCSSDTEVELCNISSERSTGDLSSRRLKLELAQEKLSVSAKTIGAFSSLEEIILEIIKLSKQSKEAENKVKEHQNELGLIEDVSDQSNARKEVAEKRLAALRCSLTNFVSSSAYFQQREKGQGRV